MTETRTAVIGALLIVLGPLSMSLYTPALPELVAAFGTSASTMKLTLSVYFGGYALAQLVCGPLSDAYGRRPAAIGFFSLYVAGSLIAASATDVTWLILGRGLQGIGVAAGPAISRAIVRDQFTGQASARILNLIGTMLGIGPAIAPTLGGAILGAFGWQPIFYVMVLYGVGALGLVLLAVPETNARPDPTQARPSRILRNYGALVLDAGFMRASLLIGLTVGGIYTLAAILPFVLIDVVGLTPTQFGLAMVCQTGSFMLGTVIAGRAMKWVDANRLIPAGLTIVLGAGAAMAVLPWLLPYSFLTVMGPVAVWACGMALVMPGGTTSALSGSPAIAGSAAALMGCLQIGGGFIGTAVASRFPAPTAALGVVLPGMAVLALLVFTLLRPKTRPAAAPGNETDLDETDLDETDLEIALDPAGMIGAAGDEIELDLVRKTSA
nr:multidrug effflux MFS transporter [Ancylobacter tetraedralis]